MARGFGATDGVANSDYCELALNAHATQRTYACWAIFNSAGGGGLNNGRLLAKEATAQNEFIFIRSGVTEIAYARAWTSGATWTIAAPAQSTVFHLAITYDQGATTNDPLMYLDGVSQTVSEVTPPTGSPSTDTDNYTLGNRRSDDNRVWDGKIWEFAIWDRILIQDEITALAKGFSPAFFPNSLVEYVPLLRDNISRKNAAPTLNGTAVQPHGRMIYPSEQKTARRSLVISIPIPLVSTGFHMMRRSSAIQ